MDRLEFGCICELAEVMDSYVSTNTSEHEYPIVSAYGDYEISKALVESLIMLGNSIGSIIELEDYEISYYDKEYVVYLTKDGVACEKTFHDDNYYNGGGDISFVYEYCNSKLLKYIDSEVLCEFAIGECQDDVNKECNYNECCGCCECNCNNELEIESDGDMHGFSVNHSDGSRTSSYSFYSTDMSLVEMMASLFR